MNIKNIGKVALSEVFYAVIIWIIMGVIILGFILGDWLELAKILWVIIWFSFSLYRAREK